MQARRRIWRRVRRAAGLLVALIAAWLAVLACPEPAFAYHVAYRNFDVWSDRPIDAHIGAVLDDAERRLQTSPLYDTAQSFRLFLCNDDWRMWLWGQHFTSALGGAADTWLTRNIYLRANVIAENRLLSPDGEPLADADVRPLSYFIAHEATHILESRRFGRLAALTEPLWLMEGYADLIGKGGDFDEAANRRLIRAGDPRMDYAQSGLYRGFHLMVLEALKERGGSVDALFADPPPGEAILAALIAD